MSRPSVAVRILVFAHRAAVNISLRTCRSWFCWGKLLSLLSLYEFKDISKQFQAVLCTLDTYFILKCAHNWQIQLFICSFHSGCLNVGVEFLWGTSISASVTDCADEISDNQIFISHMFYCMYVCIYNYKGMQLSLFPCIEATYVLYGIHYEEGFKELLSYIKNSAICFAP